MRPPPPCSLDLKAAKNLRLVLEHKRGCRRGPADLAAYLSALLRSPEASSP